VPGYLSAISGVSPNELRDRSERSLSRVLGPSIVFCLSFTVVFVALGMSATGIGSTLNDHRELLEKISGALIIAMGVLFLATPFVPKLNREWRPDALIQRAGSGGPLVAGAAFAIAWTPCVGPVLASILTLAAARQGVLQGGVLLAAYTVGLGLPFVFCSMALASFPGMVRPLARFSVRLNRAAGVLMVVLGLLLVTGLYQSISGYLAQPLTLH